jgi:hypothetical protein
MTVGELKEALEIFDDSVEVVIDHDENGWFTLESVNPSLDDRTEFCNFVTSNPAS